VASRTTFTTMSKAANSRLPRKRSIDFSVLQLCLACVQPAAGISRGEPRIPATEADLSAATLRGPLVAHVRDAASGEISLLVGTREIKLHNPELVRQFVKAAR
jgi:hypothetical protein